MPDDQKSTDQPVLVNLETPSISGDARPIPLALQTRPTEKFDVASLRLEKPAASKQPPTTTS